METHKGLLDSIWICTLNPLIISFIVHTTYGDLNCIFNNSEIADKILFLPNREYTVEVSGEFNVIDQLIVTEIKIRNPDRMTKKLDL